jgi:hypothetical protein
LASIVIVLNTGAVSRNAVVERARTELQAFRPSIRWHPVLRVDINCDGFVDEIFTGRNAGHFHVAAVLAGAPARKISITAFSLRGESQDSLCGEPTLLERESMDYDPTEEAGEVPEGFQRSTNCLGLHLVAGGCDSFHLFWNHKTSEFDWWRL